MKKYLILLSLIVFIGCSKQKKQICSLTKSKIESLKSELSDKEFKQFNFNDITNCEWDSLLIIHPYSDVNTISSNIKYDLSEIKKTNIQTLDTKNVLVFFQFGELTNFIEVPRDVIDFYNFKNNSFISVDDATFNLTKIESRFGSKLTVYKNR